MDETTLTDDEITTRRAETLGEVGDADADDTDQDADADDTDQDADADDPS